MMRPVFPCILLLVVSVALAGCSTPQSSRISIEDYEDMAAEMAQSLRQSEVFATRTADSEPMAVSFEKVRNLSSEIMPRGEQWYVISKIRNAQPITSMWNDKRVVFVIPAQHAIDQRETFDAERTSKGFGSERKVTHVVTATFRSVERTAPDGSARTDVYQCEFVMVSLKTNDRVWQDTFDFKRAARGSIRD